MDKNTIKQLLEKYFGPARPSLSLGDAGEAEGRAYHCVLPREGELLALRKLMNMQILVEGIGKFPELRQSLEEGGEEGGEPPQCVVFEERGEHWLLKLYAVTGVKYHRTYGKRIAATLLLGDYPTVTLSDGEEDGFFGYWRKPRSRKARHRSNREGFSYWMNKTLWNNLRFRGFTAELFRMLGEAEGRYILKDVARGIADCGFFLPPVTPQALLRCRTPAELIRPFCGEGMDLQVDFNRTDVNVGYAMAMLAPRVARRDWPKLAKLDVKTLGESISLKQFFEDFSPEDFFRKYYASRPGGRLSETERRMYALDYARMSMELGEPLRFGLDTPGLIRAHNALAEKLRKEECEKEFRLPLLAEPSKFDKLSAAIQGLPDSGLEQIRTTRRLFEEGERQHNCVFSRRDLIRRDRAAVYHWEHKGSSYTIQFMRYPRGAYFVEEIRARFNRSVTAPDLEDLRSLLRGICTVSGSLLEEYPPLNGLPRPRPQLPGEGVPEPILPPPGGYPGLWFPAEEGDDLPF